MQEYYTPKQEVFSEAKCKRLANQRLKDGYGTRHPYKGSFQPDHVSYGYGVMDYNGGIVRKGVYYRKGTNIPFPKLAKGYKFIYFPTWGWFIRKDDEQANDI